MSSKKGKPQPAGIGMVPSKTEFGSFIRARRIELDIRQVPLAKKVGLGQRLVSSIETGSRKYLNDRQLGQFAKALQCDTDELRKRMPVKSNSQPKTELGKLIRSRRQELGLSISAFAKKMKMTPKKAKMLEMKGSSTLRYSLVKSLENALNLDSSVFTQFISKTQKPTKSKLGQLIRRRRKELGMSLQTLAKKLKVSKQLVNQIEFGQCRLIKNNDMIAQLAQILELDINELKAIRPESRLRKVKTTTPLGEFLVAKRLELHLTQREVSEDAEIQSSVVSGVETGRLHPSPILLEKLMTVLNCQIPPELIPPPSNRNNGNKASWFITKRETALGQLVTTRRLELRLSQAKVAERASTGIAVISGIERGTYRPGSQMVKRLSKALEFEIPAELIPALKQRGRRGPRTEQKGFSSSVMVQLSDQYLADLERIKELSDIRVNTEAVRKALKLLRILLEKQDDKYVVCLRKDKDIVELEFLFWLGTPSHEPAPLRSCRLFLFSGAGRGNRTPV